MSGPGDWLQFYNPNLSTQTTSSSPGRTISGPQADDRISDSTAVTTAVNSATGHLSPEGRVSKPVRRRSRASRRTPTTLLNTDTTNFRAMVQQFTGGPGVAPYAHPCGPSFGFGLGPARQVQVNNPTAMMLPPAGHGYHHLQQQQQLYGQQQGQQYMFSLNNNNNNNAPSEAFLQRLGGSRPGSLSGGVSDGFVMDGSGQGLPARPPSSSNENRSNSFIF